MANEQREEIRRQRLVVGSEAQAAAGLEMEEGEPVRPIHVYGRNVTVAEVTDGAAEGLPFPGGAPAAMEVVPETLALTATERLGLTAWNLRVSPEFAEAKAARPRAGDSWDRFEPPDAPETVHGRSPAIAGQMLAPAPDLSAFLIGSVAVGLVLVEGPTEDLQFTHAERVKVVAEVQEGLGWLAQQEPRAQVLWSYDIQVVRLGVPPDPGLGGFEPLESLWRNPAMQQMGFSPTFQGVRDYAASLQQSLQTRWAIVGFFTKYPLHHFAYASKPRLVMDFHNDGWGVDNIDSVFAHEAGHLFGCPDEYASSGCGCHERFGFLRERNGNCESCANPFVDCLMEANKLSLCDFTRVHFGWRDSDGDGIFDPDDV